MSQLKVKEFLSKYGVDFSGLNFESICNSFLAEMKLGLAGEPGKLQMLPTFIQAEAAVPVNEPVLVLDAGGTNFRVATVCFRQNGAAEINDFKKYPMPGVGAEIGKDDFFETMARYIGDSIQAGQRVGFCFSYPVRMFPDKDGRLIEFSKQIKAKGVAGELIGENLKLALKKIGAKQPGSLVILNDTVATMLAGKADVAHHNCSGFIGFILGTGTNCCYLEKNSNILKVQGLDATKSQVINIESGGFAAGFEGVLDQNFGRTTADPGKYILEKMVSGKYLGGLCREVIVTAANDGLFSSAVTERLKQLNDLTTIDLNDYLSDEGGANPLANAVTAGTDADREVLTVLIERIIERAAFMAAVTLTATILKTDQGLSPENPVCIVAEGTTFYHLKGLKTKTESYLNQYLTGHYGRYWKLVSIENATLIGSAVAGLTN